MSLKHRQYIKYNKFIHSKLDNRFVYSGFKQKIKTLKFHISRISLFFLKISAIAVRPFLKEIKVEDCDILVYPNSENHLNRSKNVWEILEKEGYKINYFLAPKNYLTRFIFKYKIDFDKNVPYQIFFHHAFAKYISQKYKFKLMVDYHNFELVSAFSFDELKAHQKSVFLPHGKIRNSYRHSCFTFDYYFVFGESSVDKIKENPNRLGSTKLVKTGSAFIPPDYNLPECRNFKNVLFFSNWAVGYHPESKRGFEIATNWAKQHPDYKLFIRLHPLEDGIYVRQQTAGMNNVFVQDKSMSLKESLKNVSLTIATGSNASIEAALMNRPSAVALDKEYIPDSDNVWESDNNFYLEKYFPKRARTPEELHERITEITDNYDFYLIQCKKYVKYHLEYGTDSARKIAKNINSILKGEEDFEYIKIQENFNL